MDNVDATVGVDIKQEKDPLHIFPEAIKGLKQDPPEILHETKGLSFKDEADLDNIAVKTEDQYCITYDESCSNNLLNRNGLFLKKESATLESKYNGVVGEYSVNNIDYGQREVHGYVFVQCKGDYEGVSSQRVTEEQRIEGRKNALGEKILTHRKLDPPEISPEAINSLKTEIHLENIVKSEDQACIDCDENSSDKIDSDKQDVPTHEFSQEKGELQNDVIKLNQLEKKENGNRQRSNNGKIFMCHCCDYKSVRKPDLKRHIFTIHKKQNTSLYYCQQCTFKTSQECKFYKHVTFHDGNASYKCPACERLFIDNKSLNSHLLNHHQNLQHLITNKIHRCKFCAYKTVHPTNFKHHVAHNHDRKEAEKFRCDECDYVGLQKTNLKRHLLIHLNLRPYVCTLCRKTFNHKSNLDSHILCKHKGNMELLRTITNKIHRCTFCSHKTISSYNLHLHIKKRHQKKGALEQLQS